MTKFFAAVVSVAAIGGSLFADGIEFKLDKPADWSNTGSIKWVGEKKDVIEVTGQAMLTSTKLFDVDYTKMYKLEADLKVVSGGPATAYFGFLPCDKNGVAIPASAVNQLPNSETAVAVAAKAGSKKMLLKANPEWKNKGIWAVALNAKKDLSDLPNMDHLNIAAIKDVNGMIEVTLKAPLAKDVAAGTIVRAHLGGGYMYTGGWKKLAAGEKFEFKGAAKGRAKYGMGSSAWAPGAVKARIIMLVNWDNPKTVSTVKDIELEIKK